MFNKDAALANYFLRAPAMRAKLCSHECLLMARVESGTQTDADLEEFNQVAKRIGNA